VIRNKPSTSFTASFILDFIFERHQYFQVSLNDAENLPSKLHSSHQFELAKVIASQNNKLEISIEGSSSIILKAERVSLRNDLITLDFVVSNLKGFGLCSSPKYFLEILKPRLTDDLRALLEHDRLNLNQKDQFEWMKVYKSEIFSASTKDLDKIEINGSKLCSGDYNVPLRVSLNLY